MNTALTVGPTELMAQHLTSLRAYARLVLVSGDELFTHEEKDKSFRMREFIDIGTSYKCTQKEMVGLIFKGILD